MFWRRNSKAFRRASWLAVLAILFQALLPTAHDWGMALAAPSDGLAAFADIAQHLCLAPGSAAPVIPQAPGVPKAPAHLGPSCTLCTAAHAVTGFVPPPAPVLADTRNCTPIVLAATGKKLPCRPLSLGAQPRGPPTLI